MATLAIALVVAVQLAWMAPDLGLYDESIPLVGADRLRHGDMLWRDFWSLYGPGGYHATAFALAIADTAFAGRVLDTLIKTGVVGLVWILARAFGDRRVAGVAAVGALVVLIGVRAYGAPMHGAVAAGLAALALLHRSIVAAVPSRPLAAAAGVALAIATLFRHDLGIYAAIACAALLAMATRRATAGRAAGAACAGFAVVIAPVVAWYALHVPAAELAYTFLEVPFRVYAEQRELPFPPLGRPGTGSGFVAAVAVRLPIVVLALGVVAVLYRRRLEAGGDRAERRALEIAVLVLASLYVAKGWVRVQPLHMAPALIASVVVLAGAITLLPHRVWRPMALAAVAVVLAVLAVRFVVRDVDTPWFRVARALCSERSVPRLRCLSLDPERTAVARRLLESGSRGKAVYVGAGRHDKLFVADLALLYVSEGRSATRWHDLHPGVQTTERVQREMLAEFTLRPPEIVVIDRKWDAREEPNASALSSGVRTLDRWLAAEWVETFRAGDVSILQPIPARGR